MFHHRHSDPAVPTHTHWSVEDARDCETAAGHFDCHWLVRRFPIVAEPGADATADDWADYAAWMSEREPEVVPCGAFAWADDRGWTCSAGHTHVNAWTRHAEGWDYAHDEDEAKALRRGAGVDAVAMNGGSI